jgi:hypothetical protein
MLLCELKIGLTRYLNLNDRPRRRFLIPDHFAQRARAFSLQDAQHVYSIT